MALSTTELKYLTSRLQVSNIEFRMRSRSQDSLIVKITFELDGRTRTRQIYSLNFNHMEDFKRQYTSDIHREIVKFLGGEKKLGLHRTKSNKIIENDKFQHLYWEVAALIQKQIAAAARSYVNKPAIAKRLKSKNIQQNRNRAKGELRRIIQVWAKYLRKQDVVAVWQDVINKKVINEVMES